MSKTEKLMLIPWNHVGGMRSAVIQGATLIVLRPDDFDALVGELREMGYEELPKRVTDSFTMDGCKIIKGAKDRVRNRKK